MFGGGGSSNPTPVKREEKEPIYEPPADVAPTDPTTPTTPTPPTPTPDTPSTPTTPTTPTNPLFNNPKARAPRRRRLYPGSASGVLFSGLGPGLY